tara:strand:- start:775 stop:987 length:213 start_codon:yes stop_codon:yes gene_type:complete
MNQLDLHGIKHADVQLLVEDWVLVHQTEVPLRIICGNSAKMIQLVDEVLTQKLDIEYRMWQYGVIVVDSI